MSGIFELAPSPLALPQRPIGAGVVGAELVEFSFVFGWSVVMGLAVLVDSDWVDDEFELDDEPILAVEMMVELGRGGSVVNRQSFVMLQIQST